MKAFSLTLCFTLQTVAADVSGLSFQHVTMKIITELDARTSTVQKIELIEQSINDELCSDLEW